MLTNGRVTKSAPKIDVCDKHNAEAYRLFKPRGGRIADKPKRTRIKSSELEAFYNKIVTLAKTPKAPSEIAKALKIKGSMLGHHLNKLVKAKRLKATGRSSGRLYQVA